ncbi:phytanoyl-CoA dioxygenase family protein [Candidatus Poribacteria bacterium]|nr:phytanoyl-CoA dioxygenase family protein [Candidatus Poribacteria bacterium]
MSITNALPDMQRELSFSPVGRQNPKKLTTEQIRHFNEKGYLFPLDVFSPEEAQKNRIYFEKLMGEATQKGYNSYSINGWHRYCRGIYDLCYEDRILDYMTDLLGENLICTMTHYFSKEPTDGKRVNWHQDASYWPLTPSKVITVWLAIDDVDEDNAPMQFIPGSHLHGQIPFEHSKPEDNNVLGQSVRNSDKYGEPISVTMKAGQISIHSDLLLHGSDPNTSNRRRCGLTIRYNPPDVRGRDDHQAEGVICRGSDPKGYWQPIPKPNGDQLPTR